MAEGSTVSRLLEPTAPPTNSGMSLRRADGGWAIRIRGDAAGTGCGALFLGVWLMGWLGGEVAIIHTILGALRGAQGAFDLGAGLAMVLWLAFWTMGGVVAGGVLLFLLFGAEWVRLEPDRCELFKGVGRWGRRRSIATGDIRHVLYQKGSDQVALRVGDEDVTVTEGGTAVGRVWLQQTLEHWLGSDPLSRHHDPAVESAEPDQPSLEPSPKLPQGWLSSPVKGGGTRIFPDRTGIVRSFVSLLALNLFWNGLVGTFVVLAWRGHIDIGWGIWLFLTPFILIGLGLLAALAWTPLGREEWRVRNNYLEVRYTLIDFAWSHRYHSGTLTVSHHPGEDSSPDRYSLTLEHRGKKRVLVIDREPIVLPLARAVAYHTGFALRRE
jgi:hypothetical protein